MSARALNPQVCCQGRSTGRGETDINWSLSPSRFKDKDPVSLDEAPTDTGSRAQLCPTTPNAGHIPIKSDNCNLVSGKIPSRPAGGKRSQY